MAQKKPAQGAELANQTAWQEACRRAAQLRPLFFESVCSFYQIIFGYPLHSTLYTKKIALQSDFSCSIQIISIPLYDF